MTLLAKMVRLTTLALLAFVRVIDSVDVSPQVPCAKNQGMCAAQRPSSGMLGTGLAVAGGMLIDEMLNHRQSPSVNPLGELAPGSIDSPQPHAVARALEVRPVDFGNGGDWDAGSGSVDVGGGSDDGGWG